MLVKFLNKISQQYASKWLVLLFDVSIVVATFFLAYLILEIKRRKMIMIDSIHLKNVLHVYSFLFSLISRQLMILIDIYTISFELRMILED